MSEHEKQIEGLRASEFNVLRQLAQNARTRDEVAASDELLKLQLRGIQGALEGVELGKGAQAALAIRLAAEAAKKREERATEPAADPAAEPPPPSE